MRYGCFVTAQTGILLEGGYIEPENESEDGEPKLE